MKTNPKEIRRRRKIEAKKSQDKYKEKIKE